MSRRISWYRCLPFLVLAAGLVAATPGGAMSLVLTDRDREQAIRAGKKSIVAEEFGGEWRVKDAAGQTLTVMTPFHRLALAARNSAFQSKELKPKDVESVLKGSEGTLAFRVTLRGGKADFARFYTPELLAGSQTVRASFVQNERTPLVQDDGRLAARNVYVFPLEGLPMNGAVTLVVRGAPPDQKEVLRAKIDLGKFR